ncbi:MAG: hypothetical protein EAZ08_13000 [Cytophagales bacterium]|nr:MAG: hypothetical protein EAZ08_13000 [Cytophagales bacterium]
MFHFLTIKITQNMKDAELIGWIATAALISNYFLIQLNVISPAKSPRIFMLIQLVGSTLLLVTALLLQFLPLIVLQVVIIAINVFRLMQMLFR